jgi:hypothetical protein
MSRPIAWFVRLLPLIVALAISPVFTAAPKFFPDDPLQREPESRDASGAKPWDVGLLYELSMNLFVTANHEPSNSRARNVNTIDEVPDSSWFTNRISRRPITADELAKGPNVDRPPAAERWTIVDEKASGAKPGFTARDANGITWFVQFDDRDRYEASTGAVEVATKIFWALGYNQVETFLSTLDPARVDFDPKATVRRPSGARTPFTRNDLDVLLDRAQPDPKGIYRIVAGRRLDGEVLGGFRYAGTRPDDPNDIVPHEHRRELRALRVFGAWTNLTDLKAGNTLDTLVKENGRSIVKHYLQDVGSTFGTANGIHDWDIGYEYFYQGSTTKKRFFSLGFALSPWQTVPYTEYESIGKFEGDRFDPRTWKPQTPTTAYMEMRADDAFWAARRVIAFSDDLIRAAVHAGEYSDPAAEAHLVSVLIKRRDKIGRAYLPAITPIVDPRIEGGTLAFGNAAVSAGFAQAPTQYRAVWSRFDNATGATQRITETQSATPSMPVPGNLPTAAGSYIEVDISAESAEHVNWREPVRAHFRRTANGWTLVGLDRLPNAGAAEAPPIPSGDVTPKGIR